MIPSRKLTDEPDERTEASRLSSSFDRERLYRRYRSNQAPLDVESERKQRAPYLRQLIQKHFPQNKTCRILDLGCGSGALLHFLREAGFESVSGVDVSAQQVELVQASGFAEIRQADAFDCLSATESGSLQVVVAFDIIEHLTRSELLNLADEVYRVLAPGGLWIIHAPNAEGFQGSRIRYADLTHEQAFTRESVEQLAKAAGFSSAQSFEDAPIAVGLKGLLRSALWKIGRTGLRVFLMAETGDTGRRAIFSQNLLAILHK